MLMIKFKSYAKVLMPGTVGHKDRQCHYNFFCHTLLNNNNNIYSNKIMNK